MMSAERYAAHIREMARHARKIQRAYRKVNGLPYLPEHRADVALDATSNTFCRGDHDAACPTCSPVSYALHQAKHRAKHRAGAA